MTDYEPQKNIERSLRIGFDGTCLSNRRGFGRFGRGILSGLAASNPGHLIEVVVDEPSSHMICVPPKVQLRLVKTREAQAQAASSRGNRSPMGLWKMSLGVREGRYDVFYFPTSFTFFPIWPGPKVIVTMHDTLAVDRPDLVFPTRRGRTFWWLKEQLARLNASRLTTVSEKSQTDLSRYFGITKSRIGLLTEGVEPVFLNSASNLAQHAKSISDYQIPEGLPYWLYVGGLSPHKNLIRLIEAFSGLPEGLGSLVIVGDFGDTFHTHLPELRQKARDSGVGHRVVFTGFVPDEPLATIYRHAQALVLPSLWEGFGLPAAEAMACGVPILHSHAGSLPDVVGDAGLAFDPLKVDDIREKWLQLAGNAGLRAELAQNGLKRSERYRWEVAGRMLWNEIESVVKSHRKSDRRVK